MSNFSSPSPMHTNFTSDTSGNFSFAGDRNTNINFTSETPVNIRFDSDTQFTAKFDIGGGSGPKVVEYGTTAHWNSKPDFIGVRGVIYIYSDWAKTDDDRYIAGFKVGDGVTLLMDLPFTDQMWADHINDAVRHISQAERDRWNDKVSISYLEQLERIIFSK